MTTETERETMTEADRLAQAARAATEAHREAQFAEQDLAEQQSALLARYRAAASAGDGAAMSAALAEAQGLKEQRRGAAIRVALTAETMYAAQRDAADAALPAARAARARAQAIVASVRASARQANAFEREVEERTAEAEAREGIPALQRAVDEAERTRTHAERARREVKERTAALIAAAEERADALGGRGA